jgi:hypothetical protein
MLWVATLPLSRVSPQPVSLRRTDAGAYVALDDQGIPTSVIEKLVGFPATRRNPFANAVIL